VFREQLERNGRITITDERMTRFWITLPQAVDLVLRALDNMEGGEIFIPKIPSMRVTDLAEAIAPGVPHDVIGIRPGEKLHELLITSDEARHAIDAGDVYLVMPEHPWWDEMGPSAVGIPCSDDFVYASDTNDEWLSIDDLRVVLGANALGAKVEAPIAS
jgi:UDP-N-acetylglucosamine 4,6-dehydratase